MPGRGGRGGSACGRRAADAALHWGRRERGPRERRRSVGQVQSTVLDRVSDVQGRATGAGTCKSGTPSMGRRRPPLPTPWPRASHRSPTALVFAGSTCRQRRDDEDMRQIWGAKNIFEGRAGQRVTVHMAASIEREAGGSELGRPRNRGASISCGRKTSGTGGLHKHAGSTSGRPRGRVRSIWEWSSPSPSDDDEQGHHGRTLRRAVLGMPGVRCLVSGPTAGEVVGAQACIRHSEYERARCQRRRCQKACLSGHSQEAGWCVRTPRRDGRKRGPHIASI